MKRRLPFAVVAVLFSSVQARTAFGEPPHEGACDKVHVELAESLSQDWTAAGADLARALATSDAPCAAVALRLEPAIGGARLTATTPDGTTADRSIARPSALVPTALGLVASLPPEDPRAAAPAPASSVTEAPPPKNAPAIASSSSPPPPPLPLPQPTTSLWFGVSIGARIAEPSFLGMADVEARLSVEHARWLAFASLRYGSSLGETLVLADASYDEVAGSVGVGRRFPIGPTNLDLALVPSLVSAALGDDDETGEHTPSRLELRVGAAAQWSIETEVGWRLTMTVDTDLAPRGLEHPLRSDVDDPPLPAWTAGLRFGACGSIL